MKLRATLDQDGVIIQLINYKSPADLGLGGRRRSGATFALELAPVRQDLFVLLHLQLLAHVGVLGLKAPLLDAPIFGLLVHASADLLLQGC